MTRQLSGLRVGQRVRTGASVRPRQYAERSGTVASLNLTDGEVGVTFGPWAPRSSAEAWFVPTELEREAPAAPPESRRLPRARGGGGQ